MKKILYKNNIYIEQENDNEAEFEKDVIKNSSQIFGKDTIYFDIKKRIKEGGIITIPDGYLLDFTFKNNPQLYIVENELVAHDPYKHIGQQMLKFAVSYNNSRQEIKKFLLEEININEDKKVKIDKYLEKSDYRNIDALLENVIFEYDLKIIVLIDEITIDLTNVMSKLDINSDILEVKKFVNENDNKDIIYEFTPFQSEISDVGKKINIENVDTIVVPAHEEGFKQVFLGKNCWYQISISSSMLNKIKYIAAYQTMPISAITHVAEVSSINKYKNTDKYIIYFKNKAKKIAPIRLLPGKLVKAPQRSRYTNYEKLNSAKTLDDVF